MTLPVDLNKYCAFLIAMFLMAISPGPANMFFVRTGLLRSAKRVFLGVIGVNLATLIWFVAAAFGLQVLIVEVPSLFQLIAVGGGLYLAWISFKGFRSAFAATSLPNVSLDVPVNATRSLWSTFKDGFGVQLLNPKITLFFSAVLPPFVDTHRPMPPQMVVFAMTTMGMDMISMTTYGLCAVSLAHLLSNPDYKRKFDLAVSLILMIIAIFIIAHSVLELTGA